jgi:lycopene cyclase domain-containing protein
MTYLGFLLIFLVTPIVVLLVFQARTQKMGRAVWIALGVQVVLALLYTTPWDNHLVATGVWYYDPQRVTGILLGYVPLEEYIFFVLETLLVGLWWQSLSGRAVADSRFRGSAKIRLWAALSATTVWLAAVASYLSSWKQGTYLSITLAWALPPIIIQLLYGADILWHERRLVAATILSLGIYLSAADALAIRSGVWAIDPAQSTGIFVGGLPIEEAVFFFVTVVLITFGLTLSLSEESRRRFPFGRARAAQQNEARSAGESNKKTAVDAE